MDLCLIVESFHRLSITKQCSLPSVACILACVAVTFLVCAGPRRQTWQRGECALRQSAPPVLSSLPPSPPLPPPLPSPPPPPPLPSQIHLNERECSIQRRNQKVIEEAPRYLEHSCYLRTHYNVTYRRSGNFYRKSFSTVKF